MPSAGGADTFLARYASFDGSHQWSERFGGSVTDQPFGCAIAGSEIVISGYFGGSVDFGGGPLASAGGNDVFVAKYRTADGGHSWSRPFGGPQDDAFPTIPGIGSGGVAAIGSGGVVVAGGCSIIVDFGAGPATGSGLGDIFLLRLGP